MKYTVTNFFRKKNVKLYTIVGLLLAVFVISIVSLATTTKKRSFALTSLTNTSTNYSLYNLSQPVQVNNVDQLSNISVNETLLQDSLKAVGASTAQPLYLFMKLADETIDPDKEAWLNALRHNINVASGNMLDIGWESKNGTQVSLATWKSNGNSPMGYVSWTPDYNASGTWFEPYFILNTGGVNANSYWSAWPSLIKHLYYVENNHTYYSNVQNTIGHWKNKYYSNVGGSQTYSGVEQTLINSLLNSGILAQDWHKRIQNQLVQDQLGDGQINKDQEWAWDEISKSVFVNDDAPNNLSTQVGVWINQDNSHALWMQQFLDDQMSFIPLSQNMYGTISALHQTWLYPRDSSIEMPNYRDYSVNSRAEHRSVNLANPARIFERTVTPLNPCFQDWPISTNLYNSTMSTLTTWVTQGDISGLDTNGNVIPPLLYLQSASSFKAYDQNNKPLTLKKTSDGKEVDVINANEVINLQDPTLASSLSKATRYEFVVDTDAKWVDRNGLPSTWTLSPHDFERGFESYWLSADSGLNNNNYFMDMIGLDTKSTLGTNNILDPTYDINTFQDGSHYDPVTGKTTNKDGITDTNKIFNVYLDKPFPLLLDVLSKETFSPLPYKDQKVLNIATSQQTISPDGQRGAVILNSNNNIDVTQTDFSKIFGSGAEFNDMLTDYYSCGPYVISNITSNQITFLRNSDYWNDPANVTQTNPIHQALIDINHKDVNQEPLDTIMYFYGSGNESIFYEKFLANQLDYVKLLTMSKIMAAAKDPKIRESNALFNVTPFKTAMSTYIMYTGKPYRMEGGKYIKQSNLTDAFYKMMQWWNDDNASNVMWEGKNLPRSTISKVIRSSFFGLINFAQLSRIQNSSGSFEYSLLPYGTMNVNELNETLSDEPKPYYEELYHYINSHKNEYPGAMLQTLANYLNPIAPPKLMLNTSVTTPVNLGKRESN